MKIPEIISAARKAGKPRFAFEILPPLKGESAEAVYRCIDNLLEFDPAYINITFHRESFKQSIRPDGSADIRLVRRRPGTVGISAAIQNKYQIPVVPHLICGGQSKYEIEDQLIDMDFLGLENVLVLRGDKLPNEVYFQPAPGGYSRAEDLVRQVVAMNNGDFLDSEGKESHSTSFSIGVAGYPEKHLEALSAESDLASLKSKVDAGADYIVTQLFYDNSRFFDFVERARAAGITVPIIPGIKPLALAKHLTSLPAIFGCHIPEDLEKEVVAHKDDAAAVRQIGTEWCIAQCRELIAAGIPVLHYYPMGKAENILQIAREFF